MTTGRINQVSPYPLQHLSAEVGFLSGFPKLNDQKVVWRVRNTLDAQQGCGAQAPVVLGELLLKHTYSRRLSSGTRIVRNPLRLRHSSRFLASRIELIWENWPRVSKHAGFRTSFHRVLNQKAYNSRQKFLFPEKRGMAWRAPLGSLYPRQDIRRRGETSTTRTCSILNMSLHRRRNELSYDLKQGQTPSRH